VTLRVAATCNPGRPGAIAERLDALLQEREALGKIIRALGGFAQDRGAKGDDPLQLRGRDRRKRRSARLALCSRQRVQMLKVMPPHVFAP
jgi:hypothetical protein